VRWLLLLLTGVEAWIVEGNSMRHKLVITTPTDLQVMGFGAFKNAEDGFIATKNG
jgi:hypothetical protein